MSPVPQGNVVPFDASKVPALQMAEGELMNVLRSSLYPGAKDESIKLVIGYCKAAGLDPMQKPVHLVPMKVKTGQKDSKGWDIKEDRDVVMPGIGLYRTQAARTGEYIGVTEPEFGPTEILKFRADKWEDGAEGRRVKKSYDAEMKYPTYCRVTVERLVGNHVAKFTAIEYWLENYATAGADTDAPNAMWKKRPFAQLAKCAEAQALRKAFPEFGAQPTADEMEGKDFSAEPVDVTPPRPAVAPVASKSEAQRQPQILENEAQQTGEGARPTDRPADAPQGSTTQAPMTPGQKKILKAKLNNAGLTDIDLKAKFGRALDDEGWTFDHFAAVQDWCAERA